MGKKIFCQVKRNRWVIKNRLEKIYKLYGQIVIENNRGILGFICSQTFANLSYFRQIVSCKLL